MKDPLWQAVYLNLCPMLFLSEDDWVIGMVRDPIERFLSGVVHCRRHSEDPETFTPSMKAMREMDLVDYLATEFGRYESRLQLIMFGSDYRQAADGLSDREMLSLALAFARRKNVILAPSQRSHEFRKVLARQLSFRPRPLGHLNSNEPAVRASHLPGMSREPTCGRLSVSCERL